MVRWMSRGPIPRRGNLWRPRKPAGLDPCGSPDDCWGGDFIFSAERQEDAPPLAGASAETGDGVHNTGDVDDKAASGSCCVSSHKIAFSPKGYNNRSVIGTQNGRVMQSEVSKRPPLQTDESVNKIRHHAALKALSPGSILDHSNLFL